MHIAFLLTDGFAARLIIRSGMARRLVANGAHVTVVSPNAGEAYFQQECQAEGISLEQAPSVAGRLAVRFRTYRPYFLDDVTKSETLKALHGYHFKRRPLTGLAMQAMNRVFRTSPSLRHVYRALEIRANRSKRVKELLRELKPDVFVVTNPFGTDSAIYLLHARELGIPVVCQMASWDNITAKGTPLLMPDYFISWGPIMTQEMVELYHFPRARIHECGVPHFDAYSQNGRLTSRNEILARFKLPSDLPYIFYGTVAAMYCPNELQILRWLADKVNSDGFARRCSLIIRPHPLALTGIYALSAEKQQELKALAGPRVALNIPAIRSEQLRWDLPGTDMYELASLLASSAMCLNASSTLCLDACMADRPVINIGFDGWESLPYQGSARQSLDFPHMAKLLALGGIQTARSFADLEEQINAYLLEPDRDREGRHLSVAQECGARDGRASERVADALLTIAHSPSRMESWPSR